MYLAIRSDQAEAALYLVDQAGQVVAEHIWLAGRELARDLPGEIDMLLGGDYDQLAGVIAFRGPGSFTGLRIGITVANATAYGQQLPIVGVMGDHWLSDGVERLNDHQDDRIVLPEYGAAPHITPAKK